MTSHRTARSTLALAVIAACLPAAALAQQAAAEGATLPPVQITAQGEGKVVAEAASVGVLGDVPLLQTPFSVNVITRELIDKQQAAFLGDLLKNDPSVAVGNVAVPFLTLRGFSVGTDGILYDGLTGNGALSDGRAGMQLIDRVDVLKGASAFLYGIGSAGSLGGIVNYLPKRPDAGRVREVGVGYTNRALFSVDADLGDRFGVNDQFGYRLNLGYRDGEQAVANYDWQQSAAALALDWRVTPDLLVNVGFDHVSNHIPSLPPFYLVAPGVAVPAAPDTRRSAALSWDDFKTTSNTANGRVDWTFAPDWSLTAQALHNRSGRPGTVQARFGAIADGAGNAALFAGQEVSTNITDSAQALVHGKLDTGPLKHRLTFGVSGSRQKVYGGFADFGAVPTNIYQPVDATAPAAVALESPLGSKIENKSVMVSDTVTFNDQWSVLLGLRRAHLTVDHYDAGAVSSSQTTEKTLPTAALMYRPTASSLVYVNYARGLEEGGSADPVTNTSFLPARLTRQIELGAKLEHAGMTYTAALFDMQRPLEIFDVNAGRNVQRGDQRHRGLEVIANGRVMPGLTVVSGLMLLDTEISGTGDAAADGKRAAGVPKFAANVWGEYAIAPVPGLAVNAGVYHAASQYLDAANTQQVPSWTRLDLGASYTTRIAGVPTTLLLNIENATDKHYWASALGGVLTTADPLTVKLGARLTF